MTAETGYRRRILIEPEGGRVTAELEDDYHRMVVTLTHADGVVTAVDCAMKRAPWTSCPGAMEQLRETFTGVALADVVKRGEKLQNCTHLHDLTLFAAVHAAAAEPIAYDMFVSDVAEGRHRASLSRNGAPMLDWTLEGDLFLAPGVLAGTRLRDLGQWIGAQDAVGAEAGRILRWAVLLAQGRAMTIPAGLSATIFPAGTCYTFQPERAVHATRLPGADIDFSLPGRDPMQDRAAAFAGRRD
ncbi:MAG TPA: DUF2889 domain-containing protein [Sphingobium sp.]|nr:DUF2889 domain-containing protein [Sphingobium sp.]